MSIGEYKPSPGENREITTDGINRTAPQKLKTYKKRPVYRGVFLLSHK
jgi:hypothetical protein